MKRVFYFIIVTALIVSLMGCSKNDNLNDKQSRISNKSTKPTISSSLEMSEKKKFSLDDAIAVFKINRDFTDYEISDSVLINDSKLSKLKAVVSFYSRKDNSCCNLAFISEDSAQEIYFAKNKVQGIKDFVIADGSQLAYCGNGVVKTSIRNIKTNEIIDYTIIFSYDESISKTNIKISSEKRND